jgi:hypothetical protein
MKRFINSIIGSLGLLLSSSVLADWHTVTLSSIYFVTDDMYATSDLPGIRLEVYGTFTPALPCTNKAFVLVPTDKLFKETYSMLLSARLSGTPIRYLHSYCTPSSGLGRGNIYQLGTG